MDSSRQRLMKFLEEKHRRGVTHVTVQEVANTVYPEAYCVVVGYNKAGAAIARILNETGVATKEKKKEWRINASKIDPIQMELPV